MNLGRWNLNYDPLVKFFLFSASTSSSDLLLWLLSPLRFLFFFLLSFFLSSVVVENTEISPREILNDEDFNFNAVEILHPVDRTPFYLQSLENFRSSLFFTILLFFFQFSPIESFSFSRPIFEYRIFSLSWHIKETTSSNSNRLHGFVKWIFVVQIYYLSFVLG